MSLAEFVQSSGYKKFMGKVYGWGAALVLAGALFKIQHYPGASAMLIVGMGTEIIIFFLSAFEPPHEMPDWSLVYPELVGLDPKESRPVGGGGGSDLAALIEGGHLEPQVVEKLSEGLKKLSATTGQLSDLSDATFATESYLQSMKSASQSVNAFSTSQEKGVQGLDQLTQSYAATAKAVSESGAKLAGDLSQTGQQISADVQNTGKELSAAYKNFGEAMTSQMGQLNSQAESYTSQLGAANEHLAAINAVYELQIKNFNAQMAASQDVTKGFGAIYQELDQSVKDTQAYKEELGKLSHTISELNTIYGNMLNAMSVNSNHR